MLTASTEDIEKVLSDMRNAIDKNKFIPVNGKKNLDTLAQLGILWSDAKREIYSLRCTDYLTGPEVDRDKPSSG